MPLMPLVLGNLTSMDHGRYLFGRYVQIRRLDHYNEIKFCRDGYQLQFFVMHAYLEYLRAGFDPSLPPLGRGTL